MHAKPDPRGPTESFGKPGSHLGRNARLAVYQIVESLAGNAEGLGGLRDSQTKRFDAIITDVLTGMGGLCIIIQGLPFSSFS